MAQLRTHLIERSGAAGRTRPDRLLVMLHGHDATERDLSAIGPIIDQDGHHLVVGVRGPLELDGGGAAWFELGPMGVDPETFHDAAGSLDETIAELCSDHRIDRTSVVVAGFSQGGAMALAVGLGAFEHPRPSAVICLSGYLVDVEGLEYGWERADDVPVLMLHGTRDEVVPVEMARDAAASLALHGVPVTFHELDMAHHSTAESLATARDWLDHVRSGALATDDLRP